MNQDPPIPTLLTTTRAAPLLGLKSAVSVRRWIEQGIIPPSAIVWSGNRARIRRDWIEGRSSGRL
jgi:hypothetical protein